MTMISVKETAIHLENLRQSHEITRELQARLLATQNRYYSARCIRGHWVVWDAKSDHQVEF